MKYGDIRGEYLYIKRMATERKAITDMGFKRDGYEITEHPKTAAGIRRIYLLSRALEYFERIRKLNQKNGFLVSDDDFVFQRENGGLCTPHMFDQRLKKYCNPNHLDLPFAKSCHDIRRTYISKLFDSTDMNPDMIRRLAGHENIEMTMKYCRGRKE